MGVKRLTPERLGEAVELANKVFRSDGGSMDKDFPLLFSKENTENILYIEEDNKIVSMFGLLFRNIQIYNAEVHAALVGSVCTMEEYRGRGYSTMLMSEAANVSFKNGASLMLISGDNGVYRKFGAVDAGIYFTHIVFGATNIKYRVARDSDLPFMEYLYSIKPVRFRRTPDEFKTYFKIGRASDKDVDIYISNSAYVAITKNPYPPSNAYHCLEYGGSAPDIVTLLRAINRYKHPLILHTTLSDHGLFSIFSQSTTKRRRFNGTVKVLDKELFLSQMGPFLTDTGLIFNKDLELTSFTKEVFGWEKTPLESLKIPLPDYGMDYI